MFRSDKLWGIAELPLIELDKYASLTKTADILEGRRKTGGLISIEVSFTFFIKILYRFVLVIRLVAMVRGFKP